MKSILIILIAIVSSNAWYLQVNDRYYSNNPNIEFTDLGKVLVCDNETFSVKSVDIGFVEEILVTSLEKKSASKSKKFNMALQPNPFNPRLHITCKFEITELQIYDCTGKEVCSAKPNSRSWVWQAQNHSAGTYVITITTQSKVLSKKAILLK